MNEEGGSIGANLYDLSKFTTSDDLSGKQDAVLRSGMDNAATQASNSEDDSLLGVVRIESRQHTSMSPSTKTESSDRERMLWSQMIT